MSLQELIKRLQEIGVIYNEKVTLTSGLQADFYCDMKKSFGHPDILNALADEIGKRLPVATTCIAATGYGGLPLGAVVASRFNKKFIAVRNNPKKHGTGKLVDGYHPIKEDTVVIVDDVITTGSSIKKILVALADFDTTIDSAIIAIKRENAELPIPYAYVFEIGQILGK